MYNSGFEQWLKLNKSLTAPFAEWNKSTSELCKHLTEENIELINEQVSRLSDQLKRFSCVKNSEEFLNLQKECLNEDIHAMMKSWQKLTRLEIESLEEYIKLFESSFHDANKTMERVKESERA